MFGPSECMFGDSISHHRSVDFRRFLFDLEVAFKRVFGVPDDWAVLFLPGGGTLANEAVAASFDCVVEGPNTPFVDRLRRLNKYNRRGYPAKVRCCVAYDTALSLPIDVSPSDDLLTFVDCVSGFPFYQWPRSADAWSTVSGKQLNSTPGLGILAMSPRFQTLARQDSSHSMLSVADYLMFRDRGETPHTPAISLLDDLYSILGKFDIIEHCSMIAARRELLETIVPESATVGSGPVFTIKAGLLHDEFVDKWGLYPGSVGPQMFLHANGDWDGIIKELGDIEWHC